MSVEHEEFLAERDYSPRSEEKHREYMVRLLEWLEPRGISLADLGPKDYREFLDEMPWGPATRHNAIYLLRPFVRWQYGEDHPVLRMSVKRAPVTPQRTLSREQVDKLLDSFDSRPVGIRNLALVSLMLDTGLRAAEVCRLKLKDVDMTKRTYHVLAKGNVSRSGPFSEVTAGRLMAWLDLRREVAKREAETFFTSVGGNKPGTPLTRRGLGSTMRQMGIEAGIGLISPHDFRRTFCTLSLLNGAPTRMVQIAGGWSNLGEVERYSQALEAKHFEPYFATT